MAQRGSGVRCVMWEDSKIRVTTTNLVQHINYSTVARLPPGHQLMVMLVFLTLAIHFNHCFIEAMPLFRERGQRFSPGRHFEARIAR